MNEKNKTLALLIIFLSGWLLVTLYFLTGTQINNINDFYGILNTIHKSLLIIGTVIIIITTLEYLYKSPKIVKVSFEGK